MSDTEIREFLELPHTMTVSTIGPDGGIHSVAMFYGFVDDRVAVLTKERSQKVRNVQRDDRITCLADDGFRYDELRGVELAGRAQIVTDEAIVWRLANDLWRRYKSDYADYDEDELRNNARKRVAIVVDPVRVVSWDHRKLVAPRPAGNG